MDTCSVMFSNTVELICGRTVREGGKGGKGTDKDRQEAEQTQHSALFREEKRSYGEVLIRGSWGVGYGSEIVSDLHRR